MEGEARKDGNEKERGKLLSLRQWEKGRTRVGCVGGSLLSSRHVLPSSATHCATFFFFFFFFFPTMRPHAIALPSPTAPRCLPSIHGPWSWRSLFVPRTNNRYGWYWRDREPKNLINSFNIHVWRALRRVSYLSTTVCVQMRSEE